MQIKFYGVRGSIPTPGIHSQKYGGNTPCVLLTSDSGQRLILDAGTGLRLLGDELVGKTEAINLLLSHNHWDHIQGFPFFAPAYQQGRQINIFPGDTVTAQHSAILQQMQGEFFPVQASDLAASIKILPLPDQGFQLGDFQIWRCRLNHPGSGSAYKICADGRSLAYVTDNELLPPVASYTSFEQWIRFVQNVDVLIHDGQYLESDMPLKHGWGHSLVSQALDLAEQAAVGVLVLFSHDPCRTDEQLDQLFNSLQQHRVNVTLASEGLVLRCG